MPSPNFFSLLLTGQIESAYFPQHDNLYCKFSFAHGQDWIILHGLEEGITQQSLASSSPTVSTSAIATGLLVRPCVWNFPIELAFKSTNIYGWPRIVVSVYGTDEFGRDVIRGYGTMLLPRSSGRFEKYIEMFAPIATSPLNQLLSWVVGKLPEFMDSKFVAQSDGREVTRVRSQGAVKVQLNVTIRDIAKCGYMLGPANAAEPPRSSK
ncbi:B9 domain-containing protein [Polychytrium aggregatum]|uniref:B9 domain-containing protein n=1 Tax=Polychytrium aggregatum TaxID=110093 RepID=UPI0022FF3405|nr:B9 domain-containing protein [Polychytrium aggregatum]KAI9205174.1 B9 domain-containing protein [Polychytrium aggregatum]